MEESKNLWIKTLSKYLNEVHDVPITEDFKKLSEYFGGHSNLTLSKAVVYGSEVVKSNRKKTLEEHIAEVYLEDKKPISYGTLIKWHNFITNSNHSSRADLSDQNKEIIKIYIGELKHPLAGCWRAYQIDLGNKEYPPKCVKIIWNISTRNDNECRIKGFGLEDRKYMGSLKENENAVILTATNQDSKNLDLITMTYILSKIDDDLLQGYATILTSRPIPREVVFERIEPNSNLTTGNISWEEVPDAVKNHFVSLQNFKPQNGRGILINVEAQQKELFNKEILLQERSVSIENAEKSLQSREDNVKTIEQESERKWAEKSQILQNREDNVKKQEQESRTKLEEISNQETTLNNDRKQFDTALRQKIQEGIEKKMGKIPPYRSTLLSDFRLIFRFFML